MTLFSRVFSTRTLLQIICVLVAVVAMKLLSAHYDFSWAADQKNTMEVGADFDHDEAATRPL
ncbi:hypothetical protein RAD16_09655 [Bradyrhizobium sp. 18BD]